jgi:hypothetical protein
MQQPYRRDRLHSKNFCACKSAVAYDYLRVVINQNGICEAEALDRLCDLPDLPL